MPFFSIIIPTFNRGHCLGEAIESVISQTYTDWELIIVDDGSTDNTRSLVEGLAASDIRIKYVYQQNQERSAARNNGIKLAQGKYICFLDSDDLYLPNHLEVFSDSIRHHGEPISMFLSYTCSGIATELIKHTPFIPDSNDPLELVLKTAICSQQVCLHRDILSEYQFNVNLRIGEDQELWIRVLQDHELIKTNQHTVSIRGLGDRTVDLMKTQTFIENLEQKKTIIQNDRAGRIRPEWRKFILSAAYFRLAQSYLLNDRLWRFYFYLIQSILLSPKIYLKEKLKLLINPKIDI